MNQAAVGFQCPDCVREGRKTTRSGQGVYGGRPSRNPALTSQVLIGINVVVWLLIAATGGSASAWINRLALMPMGRCERLNGTAYLPGLSEQQCATVGQMHWVDGVASGAWWQLVTSMFTHVQLMHIGFNMLALWFLGPQLEAVVGRARFLTIYLLSGLMGSVFVLWLTPEQTATVGASGAIFGLMGALLVVAIKVGADYSQILLWLGLNVMITVFGRGFISWQGHLGGLVGGVVVALALVYAPRRRRQVWQLSLLSLLGVVAVLGILARVVVLSTPSF
jgi:membrane associated rhomboid family serine protease